MGIHKPITQLNILTVFHVCCFPHAYIFKNIITSTKLTAINLIIFTTQFNFLHISIIVKLHYTLTGSLN